MICRTCNENEADPKCNKGLWCRPCKQQYDREYWAKNKFNLAERKNEHQAKRRARNRQYVWDYLLRHPCVDCGNDNPIVLHFDHGSNKLYNISEMVSTCHSIQNINQEIEKCEVRCANCHLIKTSIQFDWYRNINTKHPVIA